MILIEIKKEARYLNKPEQAIEHHNNPKEKMKIYKIRKIFESYRFRAKPDPGQN